MQPTDPNSSSGPHAPPGENSTPVLHSKFVLSSTDEARIRAELDAAARARREAQIDETVVAEVMQFEQRAHVRDDIQSTPDWEMPDPLEFDGRDDSK